MTIASAIPSRRGSTLLEVLLASVILGLVAVSITSAITFVARTDLMQQRRLGAYELANRLLLQYLDDRKQLPSQAVPYDDGRFLYRWELVEESLKYEQLEGGISEAPSNWAPAMSAIEQTKLLRVRVYQGIPDGIGGAVRGQELAELVRPHNPLLLLSRNPDSRERFSKDPANFEMLRAMMRGNGSQPNSTSPTPAGTPGGTPPPGIRTPSLPTPAPTSGAPGGR